MLAAQARQLFLMLRKQRKHQPPLRGERQVTHRIDETERHMHLAERGGAGGAADQQSKQPVAAVLHESARGERQSDPEHFAEASRAHAAAQAHGAAQQKGECAGAGDDHLLQHQRPCAGTSEGTDDCPRVSPIPGRQRCAMPASDRRVRASADPAPGPAAPTSGSGSARTADIMTSRWSANDHARGWPSAACNNAAKQPTATDATNALENVSSSTTPRCTSASANSALTDTHNSTCKATAAAPIPTSAGPTRRATMNAEAKESSADIAASSPDQNTLAACPCFIDGTRVRRQAAARRRR